MSIVFLLIYQKHSSVLIKISSKGPKSKMTREMNVSCVTIFRAKQFGGKSRNLPPENWAYILLVLDGTIWNKYIDVTIFLCCLDAEI